MNATALSVSFSVEGSHAKHSCCCLSVLSILATIYLSFLHVYATNDERTKDTLDLYYPLVVALALLVIALLHLYGLITLCLHRPPQPLQDPSTLAWYQHWYFSNGKHYPKVLKVSEMGEIVAQTYQISKLSAFTTNWMYTLFSVFALTANILYAAYVNLIRNPEKRLKRELFADGAGDVFMGIVLPSGLTISFVIGLFTEGVDAHSLSWQMEILSLGKVYLVRSAMDFIAILIPFIASHFRFRKLHQLEQLDKLKTKSRLKRRKHRISRSRKLFSIGLCLYAAVVMSLGIRAVLRRDVIPISVQLNPIHSLVKQLVPA